MENKMSPNDTIRRLLLSVNADDKGSFYTIIEQYLNTLSYTGESYRNIKVALNQKPARLVNLNDLPGDLKKLIIQSGIPDENVFLNDRTKEFVSSIVLEWENSETYKYHNLGVRNKILLYGPTGNGKTTIARHFARLSGLPFIEVNSDSVVNSKVGGTGSNINQIFNSIKEPCVLFWDEVDTIGRKRGNTDGSSAGMENERMVNSVLVNIEKLSQDVIFIAATNRAESLDTAFLRRFDEKFEISSPTEIEKENFISGLIDFYKLGDSFMIESLEKYQSYSEIKLAVVDKARKIVAQSITKAIAQ